MGRNRLPEDEVKVPLTVSLKRKYIKSLKKHGKPSKIVSKLVEDFLKENDNK
jgi:hypothetical protein